MNNVMMMGVAITLGLLGVFLALPAWNLRKKSLRYDAWSQERGQVVSATLQDQSASHPSGKKFVDVIVKYEYHSNGQLHFDSINAGTISESGGGSRPQLRR